MAEQVFVVSMAVLLAAAFVVMLLTYGRRQAEDQVLMWESRVGLPRDDVARAEAVQRTVRRMTIGSVCGLLGLLIGSVALMFDTSVIGLAGYAVCGITGYCIGAWRVHIDDLRIRAAQSTARAAVLHSRRLLDYLTLAEVVAPYVMLTVPGLSFALGATALTADSPDRYRAVTLIAVAVANITVFLVAQVLQRRALRLGHAAGSESAMRWEEAQRAQVLRELNNQTVVGPQILGGCIYGAPLFGQLAGAPEPLEELANLAVLAVALPSIWVLWSVVGTKAWRRSQRQFESASVE